MKKYNILEQEDKETKSVENPQVEEETTPTEEGLPEDDQSESTTYKLGRVYELKKIYSRLLALDNYLVSNLDINLISLKRYIKQSIDLFEILLLNVNEFKEKIDEIIITFYEFIKEIYEYIGNHYKYNKKIKN